MHPHRDRERERERIIDLPVLALRVTRDVSIRRFFSEFQERESASSRGSRIRDYRAIAETNNEARQGAGESETHSLVKISPRPRRHDSAELLRAGSQPLIFLRGRLKSSGAN